MTCVPTEDGFCLLTSALSSASFCLLTSTLFQASAQQASPLSQLGTYSNGRSVSVSDDRPRSLPARVVVGKAKQLVRILLNSPASLEKILVYLTLIYLLLLSFIYVYSGTRPKGKGLFSFLYHHYVDTVGVAGYDPIQGALSPPLRLRAHLSAILFLWTIFLLNWPLVFATATTCSPFWNLPYAFWYTAAAAVAIYSISFYILFHVLPGVSLPSGPRRHKIKRQPAWKNSWIPLPAVATKWRCAYAQDSHKVSQAVFEGTSASLTGEPAGRDIWTGQTTGSEETSKKRVDERLVQEMASGGRPAGFNPAVNPNRYVSCGFHCRVLDCVSSYPKSQSPVLALLGCLQLFVTARG